MNIYVSNNRNEILTSGKQLFIETPIFTDVNGTLLNVIVDGVAFVNGSLLADGEHTLTYLTDTRKFSIYSVRLWWGATYLQEMIGNENIIGLGEGSISKFYKPSLDKANYPHLFILPMGRAKTTFANSEQLETDLQYQILLEAYIEQSREEDWKRIYEIVDRLSTFANKSSTQGMSCFAVSIDFPDFSVSDIKTTELDNGNLFIQAEGVLSIRIMNIKA